MVQSVLIYGSETWVPKLHKKRVVSRFHYRVAHRLTVKNPRKGWDGGWVYPPLEDDMAEAGFQEVETYISRRQNIIAQYIPTRNIMDLCLAKKRRPGPRWWEQEGLDLEGMQKAAREAEHPEGKEETDGTENATED